MLEPSSIFVLRRYTLFHSIRPMMKNFMRSVLLSVFLSAALLSCHSSHRADEIYQTLKDGQTKIEVLIDGTPFYPQTSIFKGEIHIFDNLFRINMFDQFESNVVVAFGGDKWYENKPLKKQVFRDNQVAASVMIGRLIDKQKMKGEGYLMTEGEIRVETLSDEKLVMYIDGKVGKYNMQYTPEKWSQVKCIVVARTPKIILQGVSKQQVYFTEKEN